MTKKTAKMLPVAPFERVAKRAGAERTSGEGLKALRDAAEDYAEGLAREAVVFAKHAGRKTVKAEDVRLAMRKENAV
jgi:histone H3/H4